MGLSEKGTGTGCLRCLVGKASGVATSRVLGAHGPRWPGWAYQHSRPDGGPGGRNRTTASSRSLCGRPSSPGIRGSSLLTPLGAGSFQDCGPSVPDAAEDPRLEGPGGGVEAWAGPGEGREGGS